MFRKLIMGGLAASGIAAGTQTDQFQQILAQLPQDNAAVQMLQRSIPTVSPDSATPQFMETTPIENRVSRLPPGCTDTHSRSVSPLSADCR